MGKCLVLANANPASEHTLRTLIWAHKSFSLKQKAASYKILIDNHVDSHKFADVVTMLARSRDEPNTTFEEIKERSKNPKVKQAATYAIAERYLSKAERKEEGLALLKELVAEPDIEKTNPLLVKNVKGKIFVVEKLSIGAVAPEIVGTDHADVEFKLSDYRGKVVLLDFWGYW